MQLSTAEKLTYSTIRIECLDHTGKLISTGTGYFFNFKYNTETGMFVPAIITNKHVIKNSHTGRLIFCVSENGVPVNNKHHTITIPNFEVAWKKHPSPDVDLCTMPISTLIQEVKTIHNVDIFYTGLDTSLIPSEEQLKELTALEDIIMIGYPNGIWDSYNNKPIVRKGVTATHPALDYNNKKEFVIDMACFPGSSGSPIFILNEGSYQNKRTGSFVVGQTRLFIMGTLYAGPQHTATGQIITVPISTKPISVSNIPNNLGYIIKPHRILELEELL